VGAAAFYFWLRYDIGREPWPRFHDGVEWQDTYVLKQKNNPYVPLTYDGQVKHSRRVFEKHKIDIKAWTHVGRKAGLQYGEALDIPLDQLRQFGRWDNSKMVQHYSTQVARKAARMMAGHPEERGSYYLSRESLAPPEQLLQQVFPMLEESE
jgi:hypothetical protein